MATANTVTVEPYGVTYIVRVNGAQAYWYSPSQALAWNSSTEWPLTPEQIEYLSREGPIYNADTRAAQPRQPLSAEAARRHNDLYNESGEGYVP